MHALAFAMDNMNHGNPADLPKMEEIVTTLLSYGADPNVIAQTASGTTEDQKAGVNPLIRCVRRSNLELLLTQNSVIF
jgi:hypothetical protein